MSGQSSNWPQTVGAALLASGFYGPADGPPAMIRNGDGVLEATRICPVRAREPRRYRGTPTSKSTVLEAIPIGEANAISIRAIADKVGHAKTNAVAAVCAKYDVPRVGARRSFRYYRKV